MLFRHSIINHIGTKIGAVNYLEIGVWMFDCFSKINIKNKQCVDPYVNGVTFKMTSDEFFESKSGEEKYDIIFIDGLHTEKQIIIDIKNSLDRLSPGGVIVCHDCNPETEFECRDIPEFDEKGIWTGTVWRGWMHYRMTRGDLSMVVVDADFGVGIIAKGSQEVYVPLFDGPPQYKHLVRDRRKMLNLIEPGDFVRWVGSTLC
jgi:hypothetical protein